MRAAWYKADAVLRLLTACAVLCLTVVALSASVMAQSGGWPCPACKAVHLAEAFNLVDSYSNRVVPFATRIEPLVANSVHSVQCTRYPVTTTAEISVSN
jgi:hypothetical protein